jgi:UDP-N-acetylmuramoyl-tripeptide--D-alanyl-D-alanine ligase
MRLILQYFLNFLARRILAKYHPEIVGITGSVGKTSAKEAVFAVLSSRFNVRRNIKNYNNELGLPLTIIDAESGSRSPLKWLLVFGKALRLIFKRNKKYPEILVLEMGADKPGDIRYLTNMAPCKVGIITAIGPTHVEFFKTVRKVLQEKQIIVTHLKRDGTAILNADDELLQPLRARIEAEVITFGFSEKADLRADEVRINQYLEKGLMITAGMNFKIHHGGALVPVFLPGVVGRQPMYAALAGVAAGLAYGVNLVEASERLAFYAAPPSRMRVLDGIKFTTLIDDTYNSSPMAALAALDILGELAVAEGGRKIAVLGDMLELGSYTEEAHRKVGERAARQNVDFLVTVGERAKSIAQGAQEAGLDENKIAKFATAREAGLFLQEKIKSGDLILIKGSQGVRMEKIVVELMADPLKAEELVCRQDASWKKK